MALFKIYRGLEANLPTEMHDGYAYFCSDSAAFFIDFLDYDGNLQRKQLNAKDAETLSGASLATILQSSEVEIPTSKAVFDALESKQNKLTFDETPMADSTNPVTSGGVYAARSDWNQNDETAPDYVKNRTHWTEQLEDITYADNVSIEITSDGNSVLNPFTIEKFIEGTAYEVTVDGTVYECVAYLFGDYTLIGNGSIIGINGGKNEPFVIMAFDGNVGICFKTAGTYTVSIKCKNLENIHQLDKKYIPDEILIGAPSSGIYSEVFNDYGFNIASGTYSHAEGRFTIASGDYSHSEGWWTVASGENSHAEGGDNGRMPMIIITGEANATTYALSKAHDDIKPGCVIADLYNKKSANITAYDSTTLTITVDETLNPDDSFENTTVCLFIGPIASGTYSHAEGCFTFASGSASHAEGSRTTASSSDSHAEGRYTIASGIHSHSEGYSTTASGSGSHAEGNNTAAIGANSHAEGHGVAPSRCITGEANATTYALSKANPNINIGAVIVYNKKSANITSYDSTTLTITVDETLSDTALDNVDVTIHCGGVASGNYSHSEGDRTIASGDYSHSEGYYTIAASEAQHAQGKYNIIDADDVYAHIVGNGTSGSARSNAHTLDWSGNAWFAGDVYVGSTSGTNKDEGSVKLMKEVTGIQGQVIGFDEDGNAVAEDEYRIIQGAFVKSGDISQGIDFNNAEHLNEVLAYFGNAYVSGNDSAFFKIKLMIYSGNYMNPHHVYLDLERFEISEELQGACLRFRGIVDSNTDMIVTIVMGNDFVYTSHTSELIKTSSMPTVTASDNGKFLRVVNGAWAATTVPNAEEVAF